MDAPIYHSKAVMGGGKSYSAIRSFCEENYEFGHCTIYCVPTKELASEIYEDFQSQMEDDYTSESEFEYVGGYTPENKLLNIRVKVINSDNSSSVSKDVAESIQSPKCDILIITHNALFNISEDNLHHLEKWNVVIDEDPHLLQFYSTQDTNNESRTLTQLASEIEGSEQIIEFEVNDTQRNHIDLALLKKYESVLNNATESYLKFLTSGNEKICLHHSSDKKTSWFGVEFLPLKSIVQNAYQVTLLCSKISTLTKVYLDRYDIKVKETLFKAAHSTYPIPLQNKITVYRIWDSRDHSLSYMGKYGVDKLSSDLGAVLNGHEFIIRTNDNHRKFLKSHKGHQEHVPRVTNGLNKLDIYSSIIDIACYNKASDLSHFYSHMDERLEIPKGQFEKGVIEKENLEPSAQAVCRIGFRKIHSPQHDSYMIIVPDKRTEDYLKEHYLPQANYAGSIIKEKAVDKGGRESGKANKDTPAKVAEVDRLRAKRISLNDAVKIVGIGKTTYNNFKKNSP